MTDFLKYLIQNIVENPQAIKITKQEEGGITIFLVDVAEEDRGKIIGKQGKIISSLRSLANIKAQKENQRIRLILNF